ncbi:hypothetical protein [Patulibacter minatonensis]|uniref:hypothetical protein n=1 Tax=Patulibacter minatonensis TaxID=298163 RepID=UPI000479C83A|nr:hypothetical protein [Patulibacter minatonensis]
MPSLLLQAVLTVAGSGVVVCLLATGCAAPWRSRLLVLGGLVVAVPVLAGALYVAFGEAVHVWDAHPDAARSTMIVLLVILAVASIGAHAVRDGAARDHLADEGPDDAGGDGGGGQRPSDPDLPQRPPSAGPRVPDAPWGEFDDLRRQWERTPVGRR